MAMWVCLRHAHCQFVICCTLDQLQPSLTVAKIVNSDSPRQIQYDGKCNRISLAQKKKKKENGHSGKVGMSVFRRSTEGIKWLILDGLSPVGHKWLYHYRAENKAQSISELFIPQIIIPQVSFSQISNHWQNYIHNFGMLTQKNNNTCVEAYLQSTGTQHRNLHQLSVMMSRVTYFILRAHTGTGVSHSQHSKNTGEVLEKMQVNGPEG